MLVFAHYNPFGALSEHVLHTLRCCGECFDRIVFVSNSTLSKRHKSMLSAYVDRVIVRENSGFDFCAWKSGLHEIGWESIRAYGSLTLMNDTCFGPVFDLAHVYREMDSALVDFWGLTVHPRSTMRWKHYFRVVPRHIQSYFMVFNRSVLNSRDFVDFWEQVVPLTDVWDVIVRYEMQLTRRLASAGFTYRACTSQTGAIESRQNVNLAHYEPLCLIERGVPFIKIKSFILSPQRHAVLDIMTELGSYPTALIKEHIQTYYRPDLAARLSCNSCCIDVPDNQGEYSLKVAVFLHVHGVESFARYRSAIDHLMAESRQCPDVYLMVSPACASVVAQTDLECGDSGVVLSYDEDEHPWMLYADIIDGYDVVSYFDVRGAECGAQMEALARERFVCRTLLAPLNRIVAAFAGNPMLGIACADLPYSDVLPDNHSDRKRKISYFNSAASQLHCRHRIDQQDVSSLVAPYGSSFWCRPSALQPLRSFVREEMDRHPGMEKTCADRALALLPVYIAWAEGYDYLFTCTCERQYKGQQIQLLREESQRLSRKYVTATSTWWLGHMFLYIPYRITDAIRNRRRQKNPYVDSLAG